MSNLETRTFRGWGPRLFMAAGLFMVINAMFLWIRFLSDLELSIAWPAIPGTIGLVCAVFGLIMLYPCAHPSAPKLAKIGVGFAFLSAFSLSGSALSILYTSVFGAEGSEFPSQGALALIAVFLLSMVLSFLFNGIAFLALPGHRKLGSLLIMPLFMWGLMLLVSAIEGIEVGLTLDFYTNPIIAAAFIGIGLSLRSTVSVR